MLHTAEDAAVIRRGSEYEVAAAEGLGDDGGRMCGGDVIHDNVLHAAVCQPAGQNIRRILRVAVDGTVCDHDGFLFRFVAAPG